MPITEVRAHRVRIPLHTPFVTAVRRTDAVEAVLVEVRDEDGRSGWGEGTQTWRVTGDNLAGITAAVEGPLREAVLRRDPDEVATLTRDIAEVIVGNTAAKSAVDCAVHDLAARRAGVSLVRLLGETGLRVPTDMTVAAGDCAAMAEAAALRRAEGFTTLKIKVGDGADELGRLRAIRQAAGPDVRLRLDANQGWTAKQAVRLIRGIEDAGIDVELVEQPVPAGDLDGMARVTRGVDTPILADESVWSATDLLRVVERGAADLVNVKLAKCGGLTAARRIVAVAEAAGLGVLVGSMMESQVGIAAATALAAATPATCATADLDAAWWLTASPVQGGPAYQGARVVLPDSPGTGIDGVRDPVP